MTPEEESALRKGMPLARGCLRYFPDALLAVAQLSMFGNEKHNPGQPLHWSKEKSNDHADCVARHLLEPLGIDTSYGEGKHVLHSVAAAWRALANAQIEIEELRKQGKWPLNARRVAKEPALAAPYTASGWIEHDGGTCPASIRGRRVEVRLRSGRMSQDQAEYFLWRHAGSNGDIIAYRVIPS